MHQQLANSLVKSGNRVLFVENTGVRGPRIGDFSRISNRFRNWVYSTRGFIDVQENLTIFSPILLPFPYSKIALIINLFFLRSSIEKWMQINLYRSPIVISFLPTPLIQSLIEFINPSLMVYYCANDMSGGSIAARKLKKYEEVFIAKADAIFCISHDLFDYVERLNKNVFLFPPGVDYKKFEDARGEDQVPFDLAKIDGPVIGYVGAISCVFDQPLVLYAAYALPEATFVLIGPEVTDVSLLKAIPNIKFLGKRDHNDIPQYIKRFDVALIPYVVNSFTDAVYSCKLNEYLSMGVPVISTDMREIRLYVDHFGNVLEIAKKNEEFAEKIQRALASSDNTIRSERIRVAQLNSWDFRFENISQVINQLLLSKSAGKVGWESRLINFYRRSRKKIVKYFLITALFYLILFHTPLIWFFGNQLSVQHVPKVVDAIVIFSGDGESNYINQSYQRRVIDAIKYFKNGYAPLLFLSSGRDQTISEVEIIRALLINRGVPQGSIHILETYPRSTFENIALVKGTLSGRNVSSILFITSPYHSRRALWVWRKTMPELFVLAPSVIDSPPPIPQWSASVDQIKIISYEYLAIFYYWLRGWL